MPGIFPRQTDFNVTIDTGALVVEVMPATAGALTKSEGYTLATPTIPATTYRVYLKNVGSIIENGVDADIVVNGNNLAVGESRLFEARLDPVTNVYKYVTGVTVTNASGAGIYFEIDS